MNRFFVNFFTLSSSANGIDFILRKLRFERFDGRYVSFVSEVLNLGCYFEKQLFVKAFQFLVIKLEELLTIFT